MEKATLISESNGIDVEVYDANWGKNDQGEITGQVLFEVKGVSDVPVKWSFVIELPPDYIILRSWCFKWTSLGNNRYKITGESFNDSISNGATLNNFGFDYKC